MEKIIIAIVGVEIWKIIVLIFGYVMSVLSDLWAQLTSIPLSISLLVAVFFLYIIAVSLVTINKNLIQILNDFQSIKVYFGDIQDKRRQKETERFSRELRESLDEEEFQDEEE